MRWKKNLSALSQKKGKKKEKKVTAHSKKMKKVHGAPKNLGTHARRLSISVSPDLGRAASGVRSWRAAARSVAAHPRVGGAAHMHNTLLRCEICGMSRRQ